MRSKAIASFSRLHLRQKKSIDEIKEEKNAIDFGNLLSAKYDGKTYLISVFLEVHKILN